MEILPWKDISGDSGFKMIKFDDFFRTQTKEKRQFLDMANEISAPKSIPIIEIYIFILL